MLSILLLQSLSMNILDDNLLNALDYLTLNDKLSFRATQKHSLSLSKTISKYVDIAFNCKTRYSNFNSRFDLKVDFGVQPECLQSLKKNSHVFLKSGMQIVADIISMTRIAHVLDPNVYVRYFFDASTISKSHAPLSIGDFKLLCNELMNRRFEFVLQFNQADLAGDIDKIIESCPGLNALTIGHKNEVIESNIRFTETFYSNLTASRIESLTFIGQTFQSTDLSYFSDFIEKSKTLTLTLEKNYYNEFDLSVFFESFSKSRIKEFSFTDLFETQHETAHETASLSRSLSRINLDKLKYTRFVIEFEHSHSELLNIEHVVLSKLSNYHESVERFLVALKHSKVRFLEINVFGRFVQIALDGGIKEWVSETNLELFLIRGQFKEEHQQVFRYVNKNGVESSLIIE